MTHRKPKVWLNLGEINIRLLTNAVSRVNDTDDTLILAYADHFLPGHEDPGHADHTINDANYLRIWVVLRGFHPRQGVKVFAEVV